jgi:hypothetical protein
VVTQYYIGAKNALREQQKELYREVKQNIVDE